MNRRGLRLVGGVSRLLMCDEKDRAFAVWSMRILGSAGARTRAGGQGEGVVYGGAQGLTAGGELKTAG